MKRKMFIAALLCLVCLIMATCGSQEDKIESLIRQLGDEMVSPKAIKARSKAIEALGQIGEPAIPALTKALSDENELIRAGVPLALGRIGKPEEVATVVSFLCSEKAKHITGEVIKVDGGQYI